MEVNIFGGHGFVGGTYARIYPGIVNDRWDHSVKSKDLVYFISTVHNYHVYEDPTLDIRTNLVLLMEVLDNWRKYQERHSAIDGYSHTESDGVFNFISSWFVYGGWNARLAVSENHNCMPRGFYSITKHTAEQLLVSYCDAYNLKYRIIRLANVIGPGDKKVSVKKNALQYMVNRLKEGLPVEIYGDGQQYRDYIHAEDAAEAIHLVLEKGNTGEIYNVGNGKTWPLGEIVRYAAAKLQSKSRITFIEPSEFHKKVQVESFYMNTAKLNVLGYIPKYQGTRLFDALLEQS